MFMIAHTDNDNGDDDFDGGNSNIDDWQICSASWWITLIKSVSQ